MQRRLPAIAAAVLLSLGLASCAGSSTPVATGDALKGVEVTGEYGAAPTITIGDVSGLGEEIERRVDIEGDGEEITLDSTVAANLTVYDAGTKAEQSPYGPLGQVLDLSAEGIPEYLTGLFEGVASGSRVVALIPSALLLEGTANAGATDTPPALVVADVIEVPETRAVGAEQESTQSLVTVTDAAEGAPQISIVEGAAAHRTGAGDPEARNRRRRGRGELRRRPVHGRPLRYRREVRQLLGPRHASPVLDHRSRGRLRAGPRRPDGRLAGRRGHPACARLRRPSE